MVYRFSISSTENTDREIIALTACGCKTEYSVGVGCNPLTGMCECLPGVIGDKCNQCPHRWVLIPGEGCRVCDKCTDGLLDVTDMMRADFSPIYDQFQVRKNISIEAHRSVHNFHCELSWQPRIYDLANFAIVNPFAIKFSRKHATPNMRPCWTRSQSLKGVAGKRLRTL